MTHFILPGSFEIDGNVITAGVHVGSNEWDIQGLRYIQKDVTGLSNEPVQKILFDLYDNSTGCLINGGFVDNSIA